MTGRLREKIKNKKGGGIFLPPLDFPVILSDPLSIRPLMCHGASLLALSWLVLTFVCVSVEKMEEENPLSSLTDYINVNGEEAVNGRVREEITELERTGPENEVERDVLLLRRRRQLYLDQEGARLFARYYGNAMSNEENSLRYRHQKRVLGLNVSQGADPLHLLSYERFALCRALAHYRGPI